MYIVATLVVLTVAGKLADDNGFRGLKFGPDSVIATAPMDGCTARPEPGVAWSCLSKIGETSVNISYMAQYAIFDGVLIGAKGYTECYALKDVLAAAWGKPRQDNEYIEKYTWLDNPVFASFEYKEVRSECTLFIANMNLAKQQKAAAEEAAKKAVNDL